MFSMCSSLTPRARIPDTRIPQLMQPWWWCGQFPLHSSQLFSSSENTKKDNFLYESNHSSKNFHAYNHVFFCKFIISEPVLHPGGSESINLGLVQGLGALSQHGVSSQQHQHQAFLFCSHLIPLIPTQIKIQCQQIIVY